MKTLVALTLAVIVALTGCASLTGATAVTRIMAGLTCVSALAAIAQPIATDPELGFATATDAFNAINKITDASKAATATNACQETLAYAVEDMKGAVAMVQDKATNPEPAPQRKARLSKVAPKAQAGPVKVSVPLK